MKLKPEKLFHVVNNALITLRLHFLYFREACGIELPDSENLVVTGGHASTRVAMYSAQGSAMELPSLQQQRRRHGCGFYYDGDQLVTL